MQSAPCLRHASQIVSLEHLIFLARQKAHERLRRCLEAIVSGMCYVSVYVQVCLV